ncbi:MAG: tetratricopeptide repeat protein [Acidobacteria bacterium]|jgi:tetratricopeptide (TPR) repeat protein|nr:tetratricopeptide repeat protein [Acidobacteriota bacterium]
MFIKFKYITLLCLCILSINCRNVRKFDPLLNTTAETELEFKFLKEQGDREFAKMYYTGWQNAVNIYKKALVLKNSQEIIEKNFFSHFLIALREPLFFIDNSKSRSETFFWAKKINHSSLENPFLMIAGYLLDEKNLSSSEINENSIQEIKNAADTDYKYFIYLKYAALRTDILTRQKEADIFLKLYPASNLRYFASNQLADLNITLEKYPDFFELIQVRGDLAYQTMDIEKARHDYQKVLEIYRDIPPALVGTGNVYYDTGLIQTALGYYEEATKINANYFDALFKKGVCLHDLGRYDESNIIMDIAAKEGIFEKGDAFYYKALNYFNLKDFRNVEINIKLAESIIPDSFRLNFLAGLFYFQSDRYQESRHYFEKARAISENYPECYYYLGLMHLKEKKLETALDNFYVAANFYDELLKNEYLNIKNLEKKNYSPEFNQRMKQMLEKRFIADVKNTIQKLEKISDIFVNSTEREIIEIRHKIQDITKSYLLNPSTNLIQAETVDEIFIKEN